MSVNDQAAPLVHEIKVGTINGIEKPILIRQRGVGRVPQRSAGRGGELGAGEEIAGGAIAESIGAVGDVEQDLILSTCLLSALIAEPMPTVPGA